MKHICHITTSHSYQDIRIFQRECCGLVTRGYKVTLIARKKHDEVIDKVNIVSISPEGGKIKRKFFLPKEAIKKAYEVDADLYHFHDPELLQVMAKFTKKTGKPVIWDVHELYTGTLKEFTFRNFPVLKSLISTVFGIYELQCCKKFAGVLAVTEPIRKRYTSLNVKTETLRNFIDLTKIPNTETSARKQKNDSFSIIASGTTCASRCIHELIYAFKIVSEKKPDCTLHLLAHFLSKKDKKKVLEQIKRLGLETRLDIKGLVPWEELMSEEIPKADLGMVLYAPTPNNMVSIPNRLFEYWACSLPVVATNTPLMKELISDAQGGILIDSINPEKIAEGILYYIDNPKKARQDGRHGLKAVTENYSWSSELDKLDEFYKAILMN